MKKYFVAEGTQVTRSSDTHDYRFAIVLRKEDGTFGKTGRGFRYMQANAAAEAARLNVELSALAARIQSQPVASWVVVPAIEITAAEFRALNKKEVSK